MGWAVFWLRVMGSAIAAICNAPLCFDGAFYFFSLLDHQKMSAFHLRLINLPLQFPTFAAEHLTQNIRVLQFIFSAAYVSVPGLSLGLCWLICRSRRPSLFIWPAMSICIGTLPGQFCFISEAVHGCDLDVAGAVHGSGRSTRDGFPLGGDNDTRGDRIASCRSYPAYVHDADRNFVCRYRPEIRKTSVWFAIAAAVLLLARILAPLNKYESRILKLDTFVFSLHNSVLGWPLVAMCFAFVAALICLGVPGSPHRRFLVTPLVIAGVALIAWSINPADWMTGPDYRYWVAPVSLVFMSGAAFEVLRPAYRLSGHM